MTRNPSTESLKPKNRGPVILPEVDLNRISASFESCDFLVVLRPVPNDGLKRTATTRLRGALKSLLRGWGLRCLSISTKCDTTVAQNQKGGTIGVGREYQ
jgi:hypothetical protein